MHSARAWVVWPRRSLRLIVVLVAVAGLLLLETEVAQASSSDYVVVLREDVSLDSHLKALKITPNRVYRWATNGFEAVLNDTQYQRELSSSDVVIITPNSEHPVSFEPLTRSGTPTQPPQSPTNGVKRIGALQSPSAAIDGVDTRIDVDVAVVDSGVDATHPDLNVVGGVDCSGKNGTQDKFGHGTMVAGFIGAIDNAIGKVGVAPGARIWAVQVLNNQGIITHAALICAIDWITAHASTIEIANLSLSGAFKKKTETENCGVTAKKADGDPIHAAICASVAAGVTYVVAAGNESVDSSSESPAGYDEVMTVSAMADSDGKPGGLGPTFPFQPCTFREPVVMPDDSFAFFSNFGADVDIAAPGVCISSTYPGGLYAFGSGTSFSTPLVAGAAALYISNHPGASPAQVRAALISMAEPGPIPGDPDTSAEGIVNVAGL